MTIQDTKTVDGRIAVRRIVSASFDEWITHVFDHPPESCDWWWGDEASTLSWSVPASDTVNFLSRTFDECGTLLERFTDNQVANGLNYIYSPSCSDIAFVLRDESVLLDMRRQALRSICRLYSDCFAVRCSPVLSHLSKTIGPSLNGICYMWWDVFPVGNIPNEPSGKEIDAECLAVMEFALGLRASACQESALHGLGHWAFSYPEFVQPIIDQFIKSTTDTSPELVPYARAARKGNVQ